MASPIDTLDYAALLQLPNQDALIGALSQARGLNFPALMEKYAVTLGSPISLAEAGPRAVEVDLISTDPRQHEGAGALRYYRLDLGDYMTCCQRYIPSELAFDAGTLANWFNTEHAVYFDRRDLTIAALSVDPEHTDRQPLTVSVSAGNYVWQGQAVLWAVEPTHLGLFAKPGISTGIRWEDVGIVQPL